MTHFLLEIDQEKLAELSKAFRARGSDGTDYLPTGTVVIATLAVIAVVVAVYLWRARAKRQTRVTPVQTFHRIADELGLALKQQWLLVRISRQQSLPSPVTLLLSPHTLRYHAEAYTALLTERRREKVLSQVDAIAAALFAEQ